jgi:hypothetical protein
LPRNNPFEQIAFHRFAAVSIGTGAALGPAALRPQNGLAQVDVILTNQKVDETRILRRRSRMLESRDRQKENTLSLVRVIRASIIRPLITSGRFRLLCRMDCGFC